LICELLGGEGEGKRKRERAGRGTRRGGKGSLWARNGGGEKQRGGDAAREKGGQLGNSFVSLFLRDILGLLLFSLHLADFFCISWVYFLAEEHLTSAFFLMVLCFPVD